MKLTFYPKPSILFQPPRRDHPAKSSKTYFYLTEESDLDTTLQMQQIKLKYHNNKLTARYYNQVQAGPPSGQDPFLDTYRNSIINAYLKELEKPTTSRKKNLPQKQFQTMRDLHNNRNITIKPADKGSSIVIMNTTDYVQEAHRQLLNPEHYKPLTSDPTIVYNKYIHYLIDQAWRLGIMTDTTKESLQTKNPRISTFYMLPKIHKPGNPGRPIVNSIGFITEKISAFVDSHLRQYTTRIPELYKGYNPLHQHNEKHPTRPWRPTCNNWCQFPIHRIYHTVKALQP